MRGFFEACLMVSQLDLDLEKRVMFWEEDRARRVRILGVLGCFLEQDKSPHKVYSRLKGMTGFEIGGW